MGPSPFPRPAAAAADAPALRYETRFHDEHHVAFNYNFSQYTVLWDHVFGWFRDPDTVVKRVKQHDVGKMK